MIKAADLFCGAGGTSQGMIEACEENGEPLDLLAVNHWPVAINTHTLNHPGVRHICDALENIRARIAIPGRHLNLMAASPECTHHSNAAGGMPRNPQSRATANRILDWCSDIQVDAIMIENVPEFVNWGPLNCYNKPIKARKGELFKKFTRDLEGLGYRVEWRKLCSADYGDATTRNRLFGLCRNDGENIRWPDPSHAKNGDSGLLPWRPASEIIDWSIIGESIFNRKRPLCENTMKRIIAGLRKFGGIYADPFLMMLNGTTDAHIRACSHGVMDPCPTVTTSNHIGLVQPQFLMHCTHHEGHERRCHSLNNPSPTITGSREIAMVDACILPQRTFDNMNVDSIHKPIRTITAHGGRQFALIQYIVQTDQTGSNGDCVRSIQQPLGTVVSKQNTGLVSPYIIKYYGNKGKNVERQVSSIHQPLGTVTTRDRFMLVEPVTGRTVGELDIRYRLLQPHELSAAMSFPKTYQFTGTKEQQTKQIGNAVPVKIASALAGALLN